MKQTYLVRSNFTRYSYTAIFKLKTDTGEAQLTTQEEVTNEDKEWPEKVSNAEKTFNDALRAAFQKRSQKKKRSTDRG